MGIRRYIRGTVWWMDLPLDLHSHVQGGSRPCVVVSNPLVTTASVIAVCPLSTRLDEFELHPKVNVKKPGQVLVEQIRTVDISRIGNYYGQLSKEELAEVDKKLVEYLTTQPVDIE